MNAWKLWLSSGVFVLVTVMKLIFPAQTEFVRAKTVALIDMDMDYRNSVQQVGALLTKEPAQAVLSLFHGEENTLTQSLIAVVHMFPLTSGSSGVYVEETEEDISSNVIEKVEAFIQSQEAYINYDVPANVSYDYLDIPFDYVSPVDNMCSSGFGYRVHPIEKQVMFHYGTDYDAEEGTAVLAFADGVVCAVEQESGYGNYVTIDHGNGWKSLYAHLSSVDVEVGEAVKMGQVIARSGQTGRVTGPHLHFELTCNDIYTNPEFFL